MLRVAVSGLIGLHVAAHVRTTENVPSATNTPHTQRALRSLRGRRATAYAHISPKGIAPKRATCFTWNASAPNATDSSTHRNRPEARQASKQYNAASCHAPISESFFTTVAV